MPDTQSDRVGDVLLGKLEIVRQIGGGGMGAVYEVKHLLTGHHRALKVVQKRYADQKRFMTRLMREARVAGRLRCPYVVETLDAGRLEDGSAYILMELLEGRSLLQVIRAEERLGVALVAHIMCQVCEGIEVAHEAGIVHRDLKPENIFLVLDPEEEESVKILDFGISKFPVHLQEAPDRLTAEGTILGTPFYMSPEQAAGKNVDELTDIYAIGVMMYEALTGRLPFEAKTVGALFFKIGAGDYFPIRHYVPDIDPAFEAIVHRAITKDPEARFASASELHEVIHPFAVGGEALLRESSPGRSFSSVPPALDDGRVAEANAIVDTFSSDDLEVPLGAPSAITLASAPEGVERGPVSGSGRSPIWLALAGVAVIAAILISSLPLEVGEREVADSPPVGSADEVPAPDAVETVQPSSPVAVEERALTYQIAPGPDLQAQAEEADAGTAEVAASPPRTTTPTTMRRPAKTAGGLLPSPYPRHGGQR